MRVVMQASGATVGTVIDVYDGTGTHLAVQDQSMMTTLCAPFLQEHPMCGGTIAS